MLREAAWGLWGPDPLRVVSQSALAAAFSAGLAVLSGLVIQKATRDYSAFVEAASSDAEFAQAEGAVARDAFRFSPELLEHRSSVIATLREHGFDWLTHYSAVDPMQDVYGIEVCGIQDEDDALGILNVLKQMFPSWTIWMTYYKDFGRDQGFMVTIQRDPEPQDEGWEAAE
jgi:hypothetical protein